MAWIREEGKGVSSGWFDGDAGLGGLGFLGCVLFWFLIIPYGLLPGAQETAVASSR